MRGPGGSLLLRLLAAQAVIFIAVVSLPWLALAAVPGSLRPTGAVLCPDDKPDVFVVQYSTSTSEGTGTSWTVFCMAPDGSVEEVGSSSLHMRYEATVAGRPVFHGRNVAVAVDLKTFTTVPLPEELKVRFRAT